MTTPTNAARAERAARALGFYKSDCLGESGPGPDIETVTDLLTDILHWREGGLEGLREALADADRHYTAETDEEG
ncbi:hypothetical protein G3N56_07720 [Desulfovibrio sulfodismutans]|uniref:Uncharacterized protein n=1 Tax=Desulfolutivibrio sulfodismutans TaxID=63561 RepID=A0A7K3NN54_9BACT|nr:hypothetical protein [Desulfolutivibrio sulfodismutans]NDY56629.1 hypothetical protein [Desulfolutivibrio sulfodismutans]QLA11270.1 hypothetical protein GD606_02735 [Desulfolutivibrio sulfodismutans DSM 3696]